MVASVCVISIPTHLASDRERGVLKRLHASSVSVWAVAGAEVAVACVLSVVSGVILLVAAWLVYDFEPASRSWRSSACLHTDPRLCLVRDLPGFDPANRTRGAGGRHAGLVRDAVPRRRGATS